MSGFIIYSGENNFPGFFFAPRTRKTFPSKGSRHSRNNTGNEKTSYLKCSTQHSNEYFFLKPDIKIRFSENFRKLRKFSPRFRKIQKTRAKKHLLLSFPYLKCFDRFLTGYDLWPNQPQSNDSILIEYNLC